MNSFPPAQSQPLKQAQFWFDGFFKTQLDPPAPAWE